MQCQHRGLLGQCGEDAISEGLCGKHVLECDSKNCFEPAAKKYCRLHECAADKCYERRTGTGEYCARHGCTGMTAKSKHCGAERKKGKYCLEHACAMDSCNSERDPGGECCVKHGCAYKKPESQQCCMKRKKGKYCLEHACATTVCDGFKSDSSDYCDKHRCKLETKRESL